MKMNNNRILYVLFGLLLWVGCADEDALKPLGVEEPFLSLPQGNHDYDQQIMDLYDQYGVSVFYKFSPKDVYHNWTGNSWSELSQSVDDVEDAATYYYLPDAYVGMATDTLGYDTYYFKFNEAQDSVYTYWSQYGEYGSETDTLLAAGNYYYGVSEANGLTTTITVDSNLYGIPTTMHHSYEIYVYNDNSFVVECADTSNNGEYIKLQLDMLENMLFANYTQEMLEENMPPRIMLGRNLQVGSSTEGIVSQSYFRANYSIILSHGDASIASMDGDALWNLKNGLNVWFLADGMANALYDDVMQTTDFFTYTDYNALEGNYATAYRGQNFLVTEQGLCLYNLSMEDRSNIGSPTSRFTIEDKQRLDLRSFIAMAISFPESYLAEDVEYVNTGVGNFSIPYELNDPKGRLSQNDGQDLSGKIRMKYDIIVDYLINIGVNVEEMANAYWDQQTSYE